MNERGPQAGRRRGRGWAAIAVLAAALLAAAPAGAQYFGQNKVPTRERSWRVLESEHFELHFYPEEREAALEALQLAERAYERLSRILDHQFDEPIPLLLYASQSEFRETRASAGLIGEGTLGFTEFLKRRVVLPFTGSYADLDHTLTHELVHAFQIDILSRATLAGSSSALTWHPPLWVMEGMAEYLSTPGLDLHTEMWMREATVSNTLLTIDELSRVYDIRVYRHGQSLLAFVAESYGAESIGAWFRSMARRRSLERATEEMLGVTVERLSRDWTDDLRRRYLTDLVELERTEDVARRLTDHDESLASMYVAPAVSPDGGEMVYISNQSLYTDLYLASALDGSRQQRLIRGERSESFETFRFLSTSLDWSPDGDRIALVSKHKGREQLLLFNVRTKEVERSLEFDFDEIIYPAWSPDGTRLAFTGLSGAHANLYVCDVDGSNLRALTDDRWAALQPAWSPDGRRIAFLTDRDYLTAGDAPGVSPWVLALIDLETLAVEVLPDQAGKSINPQWFPDGRHLLYVSDRSGIANLFVRDLETGADVQITNLLSGVTGITPTGAALSLSDNGHRAVFSTFEKNGWNLYALRDPLGRIEGREPWTAAAAAPPPAAPDSLPLAAADSLQPAGIDSLPPAEVAAADSGDALAGDASQLAALADSSGGGLVARIGSGRATPTEGDSLGPEEVAVIPGPRTEPPEIDLGRIYAETSAYPESLDFDERPYRPRLSIDYASAGGLYSSGYGLQAQSALLFSDMLGDRNLIVIADVSGSLDDGNYLVGYTNLGTRPAFGAQIYQYWTGYGYTMLPGYVADYERRFLRGLGLSWIRPSSHFRRTEFSLDLVQETRYRYRYMQGPYWNPLDYEWEEKISEDFYLRPETAWVFDSSVWGSTGPLSGRRSRVGVYADVGQKNAHGAILDHRVYLNVRQRYAFALRGVFSGEWGPDRRPIAFGGPYSLRGYTDRPLAGQQIAFVNAEFRFPFIEGVLLAFPGPLLLGGIRGALFCDLGAAWDDANGYRGVRCEEGRCVAEDLAASAGFRASVNLGLAVIRWDLVRRHDLTSWDGKAFGELSLGWEF